MLQNIRFPHEMKGITREIVVIEIRYKGTSEDGKTHAR
jgi:hypothetical protein